MSMTLLSVFSKKTDTKKNIWDLDFFLKDEVLLCVF